jgi:hypothetical protein
MATNKIMNSGKNIERLLKELSEEKEPYPKDLLDGSRAAYLSKVSSVIGGGPQFKKGNGQGQNAPLPRSAPMTPLMKVVLTILVAANLALGFYLAVIAYENWDKIQEMLFGVPPAGETSQAPVDELDQTSESVSTPDIFITPEEGVSLDATPEPTNSSENPHSSGSDPSDNLQVSTPEPPGKDNSGKHLGQTPHAPADPPGPGNKDNDGKDKNKDK